MPLYKITITYFRPNDKGDMDFVKETLDLDGITQTGDETWLFAAAVADKQAKELRWKDLFPSTAHLLIREATAANPPDQGWLQEEVFKRLLREMSS